MRVCVPSFLPSAFEMRGNGILHDWVRGTRRGHRVGSAVAMHHCLSWHESLLLATPLGSALGGIPSPQHMLSPAICLALLLLCLIKECGCWRWLSWGSQDPGVTQLCVMLRARTHEGQHHPLPWTGEESRVVAGRGPQPRQGLAMIKEVE